MAVDKPVVDRSETPAVEKVKALKRTVTVEQKGPIPDAPGAVHRGNILVTFLPILISE